MNVGIKGYIHLVFRDIASGKITKEHKQENLWLDQGRRNILDGLGGGVALTYVILSDSIIAPTVTDTAIPANVLSYTGGAGSPAATFAEWGTSLTKKLHQNVPPPATGVTRSIRTIGLAQYNSGANAQCYTNLTQEFIQDEFTELDIYYSITISPYGG